MTVLHSLEELASVPGPVALAIGVFDGLHLGHQEVIRAAQEHAAQHHGTAVVMTFDPHPLRVLRPAQAPKMLCGLSYQKRLMKSMGITTALRHQKHLFTDLDAAVAHARDHVVRAAATP